MGGLEGEKYCLKWNDFEKNIGAAFRDMRNENDLFDVTLAGEKFQIKAHKVVLTACSNLFKDILKSNPHQHPLLYLKGMKKKDLQCLLDFVYAGEVNVSQENLSSFLLCAEELQIKGLSESKTSQSEESEYKSETENKARESNTHAGNKRLLTDSNLGQISKKKKVLPYLQKKQVLNPLKKNNSIVTGSAESTQNSSENESNFVEVKRDPDSLDQHQEFEPPDSFNVLIDNAENEEGVDMNVIEPYVVQAGDDFGDYDVSENSMSDQDQYVRHNVFDEDGVEYGGESSGSGGMFISPSRGGSTNRSWVWNYMGFLVPGTGNEDHTPPPRGAPPGSKMPTNKTENENVKKDVFSEQLSNKIEDRLNERWLDNLLKKESGLAFDKSSELLYCKPCRARFGTLNKKHQWAMGVKKGRVWTRFPEHKKHTEHIRAEQEFNKSTENLYQHQLSVF